MVIFERNMLLAQAAGVCAVVASLLLLPGAPVAGTAVAMTTVWAVCALIYSRLAAASRGGLLVLLALWTFISILSTANVWYFTTASGGTCVEPVLHNTDMQMYYYYAKGIIAEDFTGHQYNMVGLVFAVVMELFGVSIVTLTVLSELAIMLTILITGYVAARVTDGKSRACTTAMVLMGLISYVTAMGTMVLKDPLTMLGMALVTLGLLAFQDRSKPRTWWLLAAFAAGCGLLVYMRMQYLVMAAVGVLLTMRLNRRCIWLAACMIGVCLLLYAAQRLMRPDVIVQPFEKFADRQFMQDAYVTDIEAAHGFYDAFAARFLGEYPLWLRLVCTPFTAVVQYFIPFFWTAGRHVDFGPSMVYAHFGFGWYLVGGLILYYVIFGLPRAPRMLLRLTVWGALMWLVPAFMTAGLVSRYWLPMLPALIPGATVAWLEMRRRRSFKIYAGVYALAVIFVLLTAYMLTAQ